MNESPSDPLRPLEYRASSDEQRGGPIVAQAITNCVLVGLQIVVSVVVVGLGFVVAPAAGLGALTVCLFWLGLVIRYATKHAHDPEKRGWVIGIWLGIGVGVLVEGICFGSMARI
jgi:hypothetical protein